MKDPDQAGSVPADGASAEEAGEKSTWTSRNSRRRKRRAAAAAPAGAAPNGAPGEPTRHKKRRKRKRGRKVFARDREGLPSEAGSADPSPAASEAVQPHPEAAPPRPRPRYHQLPVYAALDLGTNNCRLLVAVPARPGQFRVVDAFSRIVRLGEGMTASGRLSDDAMRRAVEALKICAEKLAGREIRRARLIATEACRAAGNGDEFLATVEAETGLALEVIDRRTEARLAVSGCGSLVERDVDGVVLFDIGGGSSEIALVDVSGRRTPRLANHIVSWTSLPVGVVSLAERFGGREVSRETFQAMVDDVRRRLEDFEGRESLSHLIDGGRFHLLGTSGTVTTLAGVHLGLQRYDRRRVDGLWMDRPDVDRMVETVLSWDFETRVANPCIGADRADLVLAGCAILEAIRAVWPSERLRVADRGLREGILTELMANDGAWRGHRRRGPRP